MLERIKELLQEEVDNSITKDEDWFSVSLQHIIEVLPLLDIKDVVVFQFSGWSINLYLDGTFNWEATDGG